MGKTAMNIETIKGDDKRVRLRERSSYQLPLKESVYLPRGLVCLSAGSGE